MRRYEIDSIRSIALLLLIFYHIIISFIPETKAIFFIVNNQKDIVIDLLLVLSSALNIWRIPILFFIGGMALSFSSKRRNTDELIKERFKRIILPLTFCSFFITPIYFSKSLQFCFFLLARTSLLMVFKFNFLLFVTYSSNYFH